MIYEKELSDKIIGCCFEVRKHLKAGLLEKVYEIFLIQEFKLRNIKAKSQVPLKVEYKGQLVGNYIADIIVEDKILLELKSCTLINKNYISQLINYLTITGFKIRYIINFGNDNKLEFKRIVN